jgi:hypothetical protein
MLHDVILRLPDIIEKVGRISANVGASRADDKGNSLYDIIATTRYDEQLLRGFWEQSLPSLSQVFSQFLSCLLTEGDSAIFRLDMPGNFNANYLDDMRAATRDFMVNSILASWFGIKAKSEQEQYAQRAAANLLDINNKLYARKAPIRYDPK